MTGRLTAMAAACGLIGIAAANAQTTTTPTQPQTSPPATTAPQATASPTQQQFLSQQQPGQVLASDLMKKNILGSNNQRVGDVSDLVLSEKGDIVAVLVGVGGFLGIGEKTVAVPFDQLKRSPETNQLTGSFTREQLERAPAFVTIHRSERSGTSAPASGTSGSKQR